MSASNPRTRRRSFISIRAWIAVTAVFVGCQGRNAHEANIFRYEETAQIEAPPIASAAHVDAAVTPISYEVPVHRPPPRISDFESLEPWVMSLDDAVRIALENSSVIRSVGGRLLSMPETIRTTFDPATAASDPQAGAEAALSAFDTRVETGLFWNGGGNPIGPAFSSGQFGVFSQPETMAKIGLAKTLLAGTQVSVGGVGGYDPTLASGVYAAYGAGLRQPLLRGAGTEFNRIAGPFGKPGGYGGVWLARIESSKVELELERAVRDLVWEVSRTYWELYYAYQNLNTKRGALEHARQTWECEKRRVAEQASPADFEASARRQFHAADAAYQNAVSGTGGDPSGIYSIEVKLRALLALPMDDGRIIRPEIAPLEAPFVCDWDEAIFLAHSRRVELRKQLAIVQKRRLELKAAKSMLLPQLDFVGQYRGLADQDATQAATFGQALQGWQVGVESQQPLGFRRERSSVRNAELLIKREQALLDEQQRQVNAELRLAFIELDRAYGVMQTLAAGRDAARVGLEAETARHSAGDVHIERVLEAQTRAMLAETAFQRALVDYNLAFIQLHFARGTLLDTLGVGFSDSLATDETSYLQRQPSVFSGAHTPNQVGSTELIPPPSLPQLKDSPKSVIPVPSRPE